MAQFQEGESSRLSWIKRHLQEISLADIFDIRVLGFALSLAWTYIAFFSTTIHFSTRNDVSHFNSVFGFSSLGMMMLLVFGALAPKLFSRAMSHVSLRYLGPVMMSVAAAVLVAVDFDVIRQPWCSLASMVAGAGTGMLYLAWGEVFKRLKPEQVIVKVSAAFLVAALVFALVVALPRPFGIGVGVVLPSLIAVILFKVLGVWRSAALLASIQVKRIAFVFRALLSLGVFSFTESLMRALFFNASPIISEGSYPWLFLIAALVSVAFVCLSLLSSREFDYGSAYKAIVVVLAFIFLLLPILDLGTLPANVLALVLHCAVTLLVWIVLAKITGLYQLSAPFVFGIGWAAYEAGSLGGTFGGALLGSFVDLTPRLLSIVALSCVCLLFLAFVLLFSERSIIGLTGGTSLDNPRHRPFQRRCEDVAKEFGLTPRETEVMILFAKGRSTPRIQEALDVGAGTVNTHMSHIYKKLDVHDKQELIDLLEKSRPATEE